jgi:hypothetical protein
VLLSKRLGEEVKFRTDTIAGCAGREAARGACALAARAICRTACVLNMV